MKNVNLKTWLFKYILCCGLWLTLGLECACVCGENSKPVNVMDACEGVQVSDVTCKLMGELISGSEFPKVKNKNKNLIKFSSTFILCFNAALFYWHPLPLEEKCKIKVFA